MPPAAGIAFRLHDVRAGGRLPQADRVVPVFAISSPADDLGETAFRSSRFFLKLRFSSRGTILKTKTCRVPGRSAAMGRHLAVFFQMEATTVVSMKTNRGRMRQIASIAILCCGWLVNSLSAAEPIAIVSLKPTEKLLANVNYLLRTTGTEALGQFVLPQVTAFLQGVDGTKPIGIVISTQGDQLRPLAFVPVTNLDQLLSQLQEVLGEPLDAGDGVIELQGPQPVFVKESNGWAFVSNEEGSLADLPENPVELLQGLPQQYDISVRAFLKNLPEQYKQMALSQMRSGIEMSAQNSSDPDAKEAAEAQLEQITRMMQEGDQFSFGWNIDSTDRQTYFDVSLTAQAGTKFAEDLLLNQDVKTSFSGFLVSDAAISGNLSSVVPDDQLDQTIAAMDRVAKSALSEIDADENLTEESQKQAAKQLVTTIFDIAKDTISTGKIDACASVVLKPKAVSVLVASHVASGDDVEKALQQLVDMAKAESDVSISNVKFNADEQGGVRFHTLSVPVPDEEKASQVFGSELSVTVGVAETEVYLALGNDGLEQLKEKLADSDASSNTTVEPFQLSVALTPILRFAESIEPNPLLSGIGDTLEQSGGKDHFKVRSMPIENGWTYRVLLEEGVLKAIGQGAQMGAATGF